MSRFHTSTGSAVVRTGWCICAAWAAMGISAGQAAAQDRDPFGRSGGAGDGVTVNKGEAPANGEGVEVSEYLTVDLHVQDEDLANVLQMLSIQSERNIVMSSDVSATVTADLYDVTFYEALEAILNVNGYGYIERGNFIHVYTLEEIAQIEEASRVPVSKVVRLDYLNANDAAEFVAPLLSEIGQIKANGDVDTFTIPDDAPVGAEEFALSATLVIFDYPEHVEEIEKLIEQLDTRPAQVLVEATILQTALTEANAFGVDFSVIADVDFLDFVNTGGPLSVVNSLIQGGEGNQGEGVSPADSNAFGVASTAGGTSGPGTFKLGIVQDDFSLFIRLLDEVSDTTIISNPKLLTLNRQPARVLVGKRLGFLNTSSTETSTTQTVEFLDTGTQLRFRPFVSNDGFIRMELNPSVSEGVIRTASDATGTNVSIPDEITQQLTTNVLVRDGYTIVLGGLFREQTRLTRRQVPIAGDLPIIGAAFRGHDDSTDRSEIIFMIRPTIVRDEVLLAEGDAAMDYVDRVRTGTRSGLLPWSRERMTAKLNLDAERLAAEGDARKALWKLRRSLRLNPTQPEAIRLRERLMGDVEYAPSRSVMDMILDDLMEEEPIGADDPQEILEDQEGADAADQLSNADQPQDAPAANDGQQANEGVEVAMTDADDEANDGESRPDGADESARPASVAATQPDPEVDRFSDLSLTATVTPPLRQGLTMEDVLGEDGENMNADQQQPADEAQPMAKAEEFADQFARPPFIYDDEAASSPLLITEFELDDPTFTPMPTVIPPMTDGQMAAADDPAAGAGQEAQDEAPLASNQEMEPIDVAVGPEFNDGQTLDGPGFTISGFWIGLRTALGQPAQERSDAIVEVETDTDK